MTTLLLEKLMEAGLSTLAEPHHITVYVPAKGHGPRDLWDYPVLTVLGDNWEDDKLERIDYAVAGPGQEIAEMLKAMALRMHRTIAVRYERGSQEGSRS